MLLSLVSVAQQESRWHYFRELSRPVRWWVITHPFSAGKAWEIANHAREVSRAMEDHELLDGDGSGGQVDAFRHGYWMALMASEIGPKRAWRLGYDHEKGNKLDYLRNRSTTEKALPTASDCTMDMYNNDAGIRIGMKYGGQSRSDLKKIVLENLLNGYFVIIKKDEQGNPLDCDGNPLEQSEWFHQWENPACLVPSDYVRASSP